VNPATTSGTAAFADVIKALCSVNEDHVSIILVGSAARNVRAEGSDIDLLVLGSERPRIPLGFGGYHLQVSSVSDFLQNLATGEDFEAWSTRLGIVLHDAGHWADILGSKEAKQWPRWQLKVLHGARRLFSAHSFLEMGDNSASSEELVYALGHAARGLLLRAGVFPLSRPELSQQLQTLGYPHVAIIHEKLRLSIGSPSVLRQAAMYCKRLLCHLDRNTYAACAGEHRAKAKLKKRAKLGGSERTSPTH
jgi:predicted nucleotidyltransferase